jgi:limonene-1,2-epoxide hydrolase
LILEPILHKPGKVKALVAIPLIFPAITQSLLPLSAVLTIIVALCYYRKSTEGLEKQLKPAALAFLLLAMAKIINLSLFWSDTANVFWSKILADFGVVWSIHHFLLLVGAGILAVWIWGYIRFRLQIQIFTIIVGSSLFIFLTITFFFVFLLLRNLETDALSHLRTDVNVFQYSLNRQQMEALSDAKAIAQDSGFQKAMGENNSDALYKITSDFMLSQETDFLTIASSSGEVIMRAEDRDRIGDNVSEDLVVKSAFIGNPLSTIVSNTSHSTPEILIKAASPIKNKGVVVTGFIIDSAFVDGVKEVTGLDVAVFSNNIRAATTFTAPDGKSRFVGTTETNSEVLDTVLVKNETYIGSLSILNRPYYTVYAPIKTLGDKTIGMLFVGKPQTTLMATAQKSVDSTFLVSIILMAISIIPAFFLSKYIKENVKA